MILSERFGEIFRDIETEKPLVDMEVIFLSLCHCIARSYLRKNQREDGLKNGWMVVSKSGRVAGSYDEGLFDA